ncbi:MAG: alpha mannosidase-like protein [Trizodia sp. TS-e1964]|nr:MAG: alpha mannosidase-like protein [Trizodia sp. TS-e1964]
MVGGQVALLRQQAAELFYHGFDNYMLIAYPEDELRPISCSPLSREQSNPSNFVLNDVLGNYSLTLIDSLSTLAILASSPVGNNGENKALRLFQDGIASLIENYGDGTPNPSGHGTRARGFDLDSKVQVFETVIRGVGGLLSAHLFAVGELPIRGYDPRKSQAESGSLDGIRWPNSFVYDGQLLRLAHDLGTRLLPAFYSNTGIPYPRVNLRHGIPFYPNSPYNDNAETGQCGTTNLDSHETTETCSAGAGSLVLEFATLSRLTGDLRFEQLAKRAYWAVWNRRSSIGLIGSGIDAESGQWSAPYSGVGAGMDSFYEYGFKSHILLSGLVTPNYTSSRTKASYGTYHDPNSLFLPLDSEENSSETFLSVWRDAHTAIKRHLFKTTYNPHYINAHIATGSPQAYWIDSLSAYYPGLLTLAGELEEAIQTHLVYTALWSRYSALPERWSLSDGGVEGGLGWWPGRPEFIESTFHLYRATQDPWYLHVGEMVLLDIHRRCRTDCGWAGLQDVRSGEKADRMESFFLGETAKYLFLLFDFNHPLNSFDSPYVFSTEGHPLIIPRKTYAGYGGNRPSRYPTQTQDNHEMCPLPPAHVPLTISAIASRSDIFHAASLTRLHLMPNHNDLEGSQVEFATDHPSMNISSRLSPTNYNYFPWTLPKALIPLLGFCSKLDTKSTFEIQFPHASHINQNIIAGPLPLTRIPEGIMLKSLQGLKLGMILEPGTENGSGYDSYRVQTIGSLPLGRDEKVFIAKDTLGNLVDPNFTRIRDSTMLDIILQTSLMPNNDDTALGLEKQGYFKTAGGDETPGMEDHPMYDDTTAELKSVLETLFQGFSSAFFESDVHNHPDHSLTKLAAITPTGIGAAPMPNFPEVSDLLVKSGERARLSWSSIFDGGHACYGKLPEDTSEHHQVIVLMRGKCSFSEKLSNIPAFSLTPNSLKLVIVVSYPEQEERQPGQHRHQEDLLVRPLLDQIQSTPGGLVRHHQIPMVLVSGGDESHKRLIKAESIDFNILDQLEIRNAAVSPKFGYFED